jgi:ubiquinone biosynthesis protein UbiJ
MMNAALLAPAQMMLDHGVGRSATAAELCTRLEGRVLLIDPGSEGITVHLVVRDGRLIIEPGTCDKPDAQLSGSLLNLARMAGSDPEAVIRDGQVRMSGDPDIATDFRALLDIVRPDWEEELSRLTGRAFAHEAGRFARGVTGWASRARLSLGLRLADYLREDSRDLVATVEIEKFCAGVDQLSAGVERAEARLNYLRLRAKTHSED